MKGITITQSITPRDSTALNLYLKDVSHESMIDHEKEIELSKRIHNGDEEARNELIRANLRFVITVAKQYQGRGLPLEDLISEGNLGLAKAAQMYDGERGFKFISYAVWWIRQTIIRAIFSQANNVRLPTSQIEPINKLNKLTIEFEQTYGRKPSNEELAELSGLSKEKIGDLSTSINYCVSLSTPSIEDEECTIGDIIENPNTDPTDLQMEKETLETGIESILSKLSNRDHDIIMMVFGLCGVKEMGFEEIGRKFALTGERIRQIKEGLLKKFRTDMIDDFKSL